jgi:MFS superfamily sulfate permease-like transporter
VEAALLYFNVDHILRDVLEHVRSSAPGLKLVICDLSNSPYVDLAGARMLARLHDELEARKIEMLVVEAHGTQRDILRAEGLEKLVGPLQRTVLLADAVAEFEKSNAAAAP